ncbi:hypothetical protein GCM10018790_58430 [Kitasatospora xanthocidica]|nr:hypothetical protein GCM10018790_58430 [Kitasatospora xanthocidica]
MVAAAAAGAEANAGTGAASRATAPAAPAAILAMRFMSSSLGGFEDGSRTGGVAHVTFHRPTTETLPCDSYPLIRFYPWKCRLDRNLTFDGAIAPGLPKLRGLPGDVHVEPG